MDGRDGTLAIIAPQFNAPSETFVADHVRTLLPGRTVLVCQDGRGAWRFGCPVLSHVKAERPTFGPIDAFVQRNLARVRRRLGPPLGGADRARLMAFFAEQNVRWVLAEFGTSGLLVADVCARLGLPLHVYFRGHDGSATLAYPIVRRRYRRMFGQVEGVFCVSRHLAEGLIRIGCPPTLIHVNPSGVSVPDFPEGRPEPGRVLAVGRLVEKKAPHLTIEAFALAARRMPAARLDMVGDGPLAERCQALIARLGIADRVTLHGALGEPEIRPLLRRAAIFVQHSVTAKDGDAEGFPTAIAEAMSTALPVVSTRHGGIPEHVKTGESGFLVAEGDVPGMADAITRLLDSPDLARRMGAAGRRHAMRHLDRERARRRVRDLMGLPYAG